MGGRGTASIGQGDLSGCCAVLLTVHEATQTPPMGSMLHDSITNHAGLPQPQISAHCTSLQKCQIARSSKTSPHSIRHNPHITLTTTKHSMCSSQVRCYILQWPASFLTSLPRCPNQTPHAPPPLKHQHGRKATNPSPPPNKKNLPTRHRQ